MIGSEKILHDLKSERDADYQAIATYFNFSANRIIFVGWGSCVFKYILFDKEERI